MSASEHGTHNPKLLGRQRECEMLDDLLSSTRANDGAALLLHGVAGVGKSTLLDYLASKAGDCTVIRSTGVESEMELPYAGLHQFCAPLLAHLPALPGPQREALGVAFGLVAGEVGNKFLVGLAVLSLMSEAATERPLVCVLDDAQWFDSTSAQLLAFVARRLVAEPIAMVFAVREPHRVAVLDGLPHLAVEGLDITDARALFDAVVPGRVDEHVRNRFIAETRGNPLALLELPRSTSVAALAGGFAPPVAAPLSGWIEQSFLQRVQRLPVDSQRLLLLAAAESVGDAALLWRAAAALGVGPSAATAATAEGLIEVGVSVRFCHPLVRSAVYRSADATERSEIHRALGEATDPVADPDRRAWHLAHAISAPDEEVAAELERSAERAKKRGGNAAAAAFLKRATELTPSPGRRAARALAAARATYEAGAPDAADRLLDAAEAGPLDDMQRARLQRLHAQIEFASRRGPEASSLLLEAGARLKPLNSALARETYLEAFAAAPFTGRFDGAHGLQAVAKAVLALPQHGSDPRPVDLLLRGLATRFTEGHAAAVPLLREALAGCENAGRSDEDTTRWLWLAWFLAGDLWDSHWWRVLAERATALAREAGALNFLPVCLEGSAAAALHAGDFASAGALIQESDSISEVTGNEPLRYCSLVLAAWRGDEASAKPLIESRAAAATANGEGRVIGLAGYTTAVLYNALGRNDLALDAARVGAEHDDLELCGFSLVELVEAAVRTGAHELAAEALARLRLRTDPAGTDWAQGIAAGSQALLAVGREAEDHYRLAIDLLERSGIAIHEARAHLTYGEWLRRENRRQDAREHLRIAYQMFGGFGAEAFAERARRELIATGETVHKRSQSTRDLLTPQELQVARLAAERHTNPEIGSQLYLSPRTVEYHLHKVFAKLNISSRRELAGALKAGD